MTNQQTQDTEGIRRVEEKLDKLIEGLPKTYAGQSETDRRFNALESLIHAIQTQIDTWQGIYRQEMKWAVDEHNGINKAVEESERRILMEIKENTKITQDNKRFNKGNRIAILLCTIGWILTVVLFIAGVIITHAWPK